MRALVPMEDAQASFQILRLSATSRLSYLLRTVPPSITCQASANYDALVEWALASIIAGDAAAAAGLPTPEEVAHDPTVCENQTYLGHGALRQAHLPTQEGGLGLTSSSSIQGAAYIGCHALVLGRVVAASARGRRGGGRGGGGVGQREQWEYPLATQPDKEIELSQTNQGVGGVCVGVVPRV